jgi:hypothetical protein
MAIFVNEISGFGGPGGCTEMLKNQILGNQWDCAAFKSLPMFFDVFCPTV